jgi:hypothetical protein
MKIVRVALAAVALMMCASAGAGMAQAAGRVALVIGNGAYSKVPALPNPTNDAGDIANSLQKIGFSVKTVTDGKFDDMRRALIEFGRDARNAEVALVFYAGHGMEVGGENWLIPVDAELLNDTDAENEAINLKAVTLQVAKASQLGLVILDACRNNPFSAKMTRSLRTRAVPRGLAATEPTENVLVAYAARDGTTANDGAGRTSPFTTALLNNLEKPLEVTFLFRHVRDEVMATTQREQQPFVYGSLSKDAIYLKQPDGNAVDAATPAPAAPRPAAPQVASLPPQTAPRAINAFDGTWATTQNCPDVGKVKGYNWTYKVVVKDGKLAGGHDAKTGGTLALSGTIKPDGSAYLEADGKVGSTAYAVGGVKSGSAVKYYVDAKFAGHRGTGSRLTTRKCDFTFVRLD